VHGVVYVCKLLAIVVMLHYVKFKFVSTESYLKVVVDVQTACMTGTSHYHISLHLLVNIIATDV